MQETALARNQQNRHLAKAIDTFDDGGSEFMRGRFASQPRGRGSWKCRTVLDQPAARGEWYKEFLSCERGHRKRRLVKIQ